MEDEDSFEKKYIDSEPAKPIIKTLCGVIDAFLTFIITKYLLHFVIPINIWEKLTNNSPVLIILICFFIYRVVCLLTIKKTIGMLFCKVKFLNNRLEKLAFLENILIGFFIAMNGVRLYNVR
jgi:uncharacterized RDD family membrane protein YckC